ncbi:hypothetical protein JY458_11185 [Stenotrophomonas maltophilia]|nr:hypothetical protein [Stenotrophomonas maltophilia]
MARELLPDVRKSILNSILPALEKQCGKRRVGAIERSGKAMDNWLANARLVDRTRAVRRHIIDRDILPVFRNHPLSEIQADYQRALYDEVKERAAPSTTV